jgi:hypothetical protein
MRVATSSKSVDGTVACALVCFLIDWVNAGSPPRTR